MKAASRKGALRSMKHAPQEAILLKLDITHEKKKKQTDLKGL